MNSACLLCCLEQGVRRWSQTPPPTQDEDKVSSSPLLVCLKSPTGRRNGQKAGDLFLPLPFWRKPLLGWRKAAEATSPDSGRGQSLVDTSWEDE